MTYLPNSCGRKIDFYWNYRLVYFGSRLMVCKVHYVFGEPKSLIILNKKESGPTIEAFFNEPLRYDAHQRKFV